ncbi:MAG: hypothetical protein IKT65_04230 [Clostridia bacterium]|nr:hypothetical protein [Clostridia bacterium]
MSIGTAIYEKEKGYETQDKTFDTCFTCLRYDLEHILLTVKRQYRSRQYRKAEGSPTSQMLPNITEYAEYRAVQLGAARQ